MPLHYSVERKKVRIVQKALDNSSVTDHSVQLEMANHREGFPSRQHHHHVQALPLSEPKEVRECLCRFTMFNIRSSTRYTKITGIGSRIESQ